MKILVSACLLGHRCKYNGGDNYSETVAALAQRHQLLPVCPELAGGLSVPRHPCEIVRGTVMNDRGDNVDGAFRRGAAICLQKALDEKIDLAILQSRSPSCGVKQIYDGTFSGTLIQGSGVFAQLLREHGIPAADVSDAEEALAERRKGHGSQVDQADKEI